MNFDARIFKISWILEIVEGFYEKPNFQKSGSQCDYISRMTRSIELKFFVDIYLS